MVDPPVLLDCPVTSEEMDFQGPHCVTGVAWVLDPGPAWLKYCVEPGTFLLDLFYN